MKYLKYLWIMFAALLGPANAEESHLQYGEWTASRIGGGGYLTNLTFAPSDSNIIYCVGDVGGLFKSTDGGKKWHMIHGTTYPAFYFVRGVDVDPRDSDTLLVASGSIYGGGIQGIYRSTNGGRNWRIVCRAKLYGNSKLKPTGVVFARDPRRPDSIYVAAADGIFHSQDNGVNWKNLGMGGYCPTDLKMDSTDSSRLWFCAAPEKRGEANLQGGFFLTEDGGATWKKLADQGPLEIHQAPWDPALLYALFNYSYPAISRDKGKTWKKLTAGLKSLSLDRRPGGKSDAFYSAMGTGPDFVLLASGQGTFYRLNRGEERWREIPYKSHLGNWFLAPQYTGGWQHFGRAIASVTVDPRNPDHWLFTDWYAVYQTKDAGKNWLLSVDGMEMTVIHCVIPDPNIPGRVYVGLADLRILISNDYGKTFFTAKNAVGNVKSIAISRQKPERIYAAGPREWAWESNWIYTSTRPETSWKKLLVTGIDLTRDNINSLVVSPTDADRVFVGRSGSIAPDQGGVYMSVDGGGNFVWFSAGMEEEKDFFRKSIWHSGAELAISGDGKHLAAISQRSPNLYICEIAKGRWEKVADPPVRTLYTIVGDPLASKRFYLASRGSGLHRSDDGGRTWLPLYPGNVYEVTCDPHVKDRIAIALGKEEKILVSDDAGAHWRELCNKLPNRKGLKLCFSGNFLLAGTDGNGIFRTDLSQHPGTPVEKSAETNLLKTGQWRIYPRKENGPADFHENTELLRFETSSVTSVSLSQNLGHHFKGKTLSVRTDATVQGETVEEFALALQFFDRKGKQNGFKHLIWKKGGFTAPLAGEIQVPETAEQVSFLIIAKGKMRVALNHLILTEKSQK